MCEVRQTAVGSCTPLFLPLPPPSPRSFLQDASEAQHTEVQALTQVLLHLQSDEVALASLADGSDGPGSSSGAEPSDAALAAFRAGVYDWSSLGATLTWAKSQPEAWADEDTAFQAQRAEKVRNEGDDRGLLTISNPCLPVPSALSHPLSSRTPLSCMQEARLAEERAATAAAQAAVTALQARRDRLAVEVAATQAAAAEARKVTTAMHTRVDGAKAMLAKLQVELSAREADLERVGSMVAEEEAEVTQLRAQEAALKKECAALTTEVNRIEANLRRNAAVASKPAIVPAKAALPQAGGGKAAPGSVGIVPGGSGSFPAPGTHPSSHGAQRLQPVAAAPQPFQLPRYQQQPTHPQQQEEANDDAAFAALMEDIEEADEAATGSGAGGGWGSSHPPAPTHPLPPLQWDWGSSGSGHDGWGGGNGLS